MRTKKQQDIGIVLAVLSSCIYVNDTRVARELYTLNIQIE